MSVSARLSNLQEKLEFVQKYIDSMHDEQAIILLELQKAYYNIEEGVQETALDLLKKQYVKIEGLYNFEKIVMSCYYKYQAFYHLKRDEYSDFYHNSLQFLALADDDDFEPGEKEQLCINMAVAVLVSQKIFNYSELLELKVFACLKTGENSWIYKLMQTFDKGDVKELKLDMENFNQQISQNNALNLNKNTLSDKISIMAFTDLIFSLPKNDRIVSFKQISDRANLDENVVELMVLKAMSLELIRGLIDQVDRTVSITFIQPRVLDKTRIATMRGKFEYWEGNLQKLMKVIETHNQSLC